MLPECLDHSATPSLLILFVLQSESQFQKIQEMEKEIHAVQLKYQECDTQLNRCEDVLKDLTEKLAEKQKEVGIYLKYF